MPHRQHRIQHGRRQRIVLAGGMTGLGEIDDQDRMRHALRIRVGAAEQCRRQDGGGCGVADSHLAHAQQVGLHVDHCITAREIFGELVDRGASGDKIADHLAAHGETPWRTAS